MALRAKYNYEAEYSDVITTFLEAKLKELVYIEQPHGFTNSNREDTCHLLRALYGLKQSPREWYITLREFLERFGYVRLTKDHSVFIHGNGVVVGIYMDDILMLRPSKKVISELKEQLDTRFKMKHLGDMSYYLGMSVTRDWKSRTIWINQSGFAKQLVEQLDLINCNTASTPMDCGSELHAAPDDYTADKEDAAGYRSLVGALQWLVTMTRPDLAYSVGKCGRWSNNPTSEHLTAVKRITRYLAGTLDYGLCYGPKDVSRGINPDGKLVGWTDSSWADCKDTSRATSGYIYQLWNGPISWSSKRQDLCTLSTAEAEYVGQANAAKEALFLSQLLREFGYDEGDVRPVRLLADNQSAIKMASNPVNHSRTKHIRNKYHFVRELVAETGDLVMGYVPTSDMLADGLTKPLGPQLFLPYRAMLGLAPRGRV